jgi:mono/diheme cytochrome c family protein
MLTPVPRLLPASLLVLLLCAPTGASAQGADRPTRGRLLYETHCIACHNSQVHWRDQRLAQDWEGLVGQVRDWQARAALYWGDDDIVEVARHLNDTIYRFRRPAPARPLAQRGAEP